MEFCISDRVTYEKFADGTAKDISDEIPFKLPQGWAWCRIKEVTLLKRGEYVTRKQIQEGEIPVILGGQEPAYYCNKHNHDGPCVVISRSGASAGFASYWESPIFVTDGFLFECLDGLSTKFFFYWYKSFPLIKLQRGTGMPHVQAQILNGLLFPLPPHAEQKRIVSKIEELFVYTDKIGKASDGLAQATQRIDKKILDLAIRGQLVPQDPNDEPACELIKRIEAVKNATNKGNKSSRTTASDRPAYEINPPFDIPVSWEWVRLGDVLLPMETKRPQGETFQYIDIDAIDNTNNVVLTPKRLPVAKAPSRASRGLKAGDTLFAVVRPYLRNIAYIDDSLADCIASTGFYVCRPNEMVDPRFLFWLLLSDYVVNGLNAFMKGDNSPSIRGGQLHDYPIPLPPIDEQGRIVAKVEELKAMISNFVNS